MSVIWNSWQALTLNHFSSRLVALQLSFMSYNPYKKRGGGPNRGGGRGGRGRGRGGGGRGGGGPPPGLSGKAIGMYYKKKSQQMKQEREKNEVRTILLYTYEYVCYNSIL